MQCVVLVGHSFGGAVVITAGAVNDRVAGVVAFASQTYGARLAGQLAPRPLLVVHGKADTRLPYTCGVQIYDWAQEPKQLVLYEGTEHRLDECAEDLDQLLTQWIPATSALQYPHSLLHMLPYIDTTFLLCAVFRKVCLHDRCLCLPRALAIRRCQPSPTDKSLRHACACRSISPLRQESRWRLK